MPAGRVEADAEGLDVGILAGVTVKWTMVSIARRPTIIANVGTKAIR
jgi:hypothetical protein